MLKPQNAICLAFVLSGLAAALSAQPLSPPANTSLMIDGKTLTIEYYAPSMRGRKIMGSLVPFGEVWCPGANWATKLTTDSDLELRIGDAALKLPKGSYSLWAIPNEKEWTLIVNSETGQFHLSYNMERDFGRIKMDLSALVVPVETFKIQLAATGSGKGKLSFIWETTEASIPFSLVP